MATCTRSNRRHLNRSQKPRHCRELGSARFPIFSIDSDESILKLRDLSDKSEPPSALQIDFAPSYTSDALVSPRTPDGAHRFHLSLAGHVIGIRRRCTHQCRANPRACFSCQVHDPSVAPLYAYRITLFRNRHKRDPEVRLQSRFSLHRSPWHTHRALGKKPGGKLSTTSAPTYPIPP